MAARRIKKKRRRAAKWWVHPLLLSAMLAGLVLRAVSMVQTDFGYDEIMQARVSLVGLGEVAKVARSHFGASPLDYYFCWVAGRIFGTATSLRFPALLWGVAAIAMGWRAGRRFGGKRQAVIAAWLIAFSPMLVFSSQLIRWYSALVFFSLAIPVTASFYYSRPSRKNGIFLILSVAAGFLEHPFVIFPLVSVMGALLFKGIKARKHRPASKPFRRYLQLAGLTLLSTIPFIVWAIYAGVGKGSPFKPPEWGWELFRKPFYWFSGGMPLYSTITLILLAIGMIALFFRKPPKGLFLLLLLVTWPLLIRISIKRSYIFYARHIIYILPWILVGAAFGLTFLSRLFSRILPPSLKRAPAFLLVVLYILPLTGKAPTSDWDFGKIIPTRIIRTIIHGNMRPDTYFILPSYLYNPIEFFALQTDGLKERIWETSGPSGGARDLSFPLRVMWISHYPPSAWIRGSGLCYENVYVFYETYENPKALGERLVNFGFQAFVLADSASKDYMQSEMKSLARRWEIDIDKWFSRGFRTHEDFLESNSLTIKAQPLLREKKYREAEQILREAVERNPYSAHAMGSLAFSIQGQKKLLEAMKTWLRVLEICPNFFEAYWNLSQIHHRLGQKDLALKAASRAIRFPEADVNVYDFYGKLLRNAGKDAEADALLIQMELRKKRR